LLVPVQLFHVCFLGIDDCPRHMIGIVEVNDDHQHVQKQEQRLLPVEQSACAAPSIVAPASPLGQASPADDAIRPPSVNSDFHHHCVAEFGTKTHLETGAASGTETRSETGSCNFMSTDEQCCATSCWVLPRSQNWTITHASLQFTLAWGGDVPSALRRLTSKKFEKLAARALEVTSDEDFAALAVELHNMRLHPLHMKTQQLQMETSLRFWKSQSAEDVEELPDDTRQRLAPGDKVVRVDMANFRWTRSAPRRSPSIFFLQKTPETGIASDRRTELATVPAVEKVVTL